MRLCPNLAPKPTSLRNSTYCMQCAVFVGFCRIYLSQYCWELRSLFPDRPSPILHHIVTNVYETFYIFVKLLVQFT